tara:strand:- start:38 stop:529 length:492 start_codon:yes stop_codon:yes gene_type:complete
MSILSAYLSKSKVRKVLASKPGEDGFSLIELVVVVAVLAVLSAIAIPQFTNISQKARAAAASNTLATIAKECASKLADAGTGTAVIPNLQGYVKASGNSAGFYEGSTLITPGNTLTCSENHTIRFESEDEAIYPSFIYNTNTGAKTCDASGAALNRGCNGTVW